MFYGFDFDASMLRVASMNMMLHGIENPNIFYQDAFSQNFYERNPKQAKSYFDVKIDDYIVSSKENKKVYY